MIDVETGGTDPGHAPVIQLSAVRFCMKTKTIDTASMFDRCLIPAPGRYWDESTRDWWLNTNPDLLTKILQRGEPAEIVLRAFQNWVFEVPVAAHRHMWAKPISFEWPMLAGYFRQFDLELPFHYRYARDANSWLAGRGIEDTSAHWASVPFQGEAHNALHDVINQIAGVFAAL